MTAIAVGCGGNVLSVFPCCVSAVVARGATTGNRGVIHADIRPIVRYVAIITGIGAGNVIRGFAFSGGAVVARRAGAEYSVVIHARDGLKA